jgi:ribosomal protein S18 acetylase RimI-like enzyme
MRFPNRMFDIVANEGHYLFQNHLAATFFFKMEIDLNNVVIRHVREPDIEAMTSHRIAYLIEMQGERDETYLQLLKNQLEAYFRKSIASGTLFALVATLEEQILGYGAMVLRNIPGDLNKASYIEGDILNMYTLPYARRQGIGTLILKQLLANASSMGLSKVALHTSEDGEKLYRSFGFSEPVYPYLELILYG